MNLPINVFIANELLLTLVMLMMVLLLRHVFPVTVVISSHLRREMPLWEIAHVLLGELVYPWVIVLWGNWVNLCLPGHEVWSK